MRPRFCHATHIKTFALSADWEATMYENVVSIDEVRFHSLLAVSRPGVEIPALWIASEWDATRPETYENPQLGLFLPDEHLALGRDPRWFDPLLFLLRATELARLQLDCPPEDLGDPEAWAFAQMEPVIRRRPSEVDDPERLARYRDAFAHYEHRVMDRIRRHAGL